MASIDVHRRDERGKPTAWRARWRTPEGESRSKVFPTMGEAKAHVATVEHRKGAGTYVDAQLGRERFRDYAKRWADAQDWKASTRRDTWPKILNRLEPHIGGLRLADIDRLTLERLRATLAERYARSVVEGTMHRAMAVLRHAYANGVIGRDPTTGVKAAPKRRADDTSGRVTPEQIPTRAEALAILAAAPEGYRAAIALGLAGLRIGEVLGLEWSKVDLVNRRVRIDQQTDGYAVTTPKCEKVRTVAVPDLVAVELRRHRRDHATDRWLFPGGGVEGTLHRVRFYKVAWGRALRAAGLEGRFTFHALRHFAASTLLAEGAPITAVAGHLGDVIGTVQKVYAHWLRDDRDIPAEVLGRVLAPAAEPAVVSIAPVGP